VGVLLKSPQFIVETIELRSESLSVLHELDHDPGHMLNKKLFSRAKRLLGWTVLTYTAAVVDKYQRETKIFTKQYQS
jgi:hypothetical protein